MATQYDFTQGSIKRKMLYFSAPIFLANLLQTSYQFIDSLWVGNLLGTEALAAITMAAPVIFTVLSFIIGVNGATLTVLSQKKGEGDEEGLKIALNSFVFVLTIMSIIFGLIGIIVARPLLILLDTPSDVVPLATNYLRITFSGILFLFGYNFISTILRALGDSKTPIRFVAIAVGLNTVLVPIMIVGFGFGVEGAAISTVISQGVAFIYGLIYSIKKANVPFSKPTLPSNRYFKMIFKLGAPSGLQMMAISAGTASITAIVAMFGEDVLAGYGAAQRINMLIMIPAFTLGTTVTSMAGQNIGAEQWKRVNDIGKNGLMFIIAIMLAIGCVLFLLSDIMIRWFIKDPAAIAFGSLYLKGVAFFYPFLGINFILNGVVRAAGAMFQILVLNLISFWILRFPLTLWFSQWWGKEAIPFGIGASFIISSLFAIGYYRLGRWREIRLMDPHG